MYCGCGSASATCSVSAGVPAGTPNSPSSHRNRSFPASAPGSGTMPGACALPDAPNTASRSSGTVPRLRLSASVASTSGTLPRPTCSLVTACGLAVSWAWAARSLAWASPAACSASISSFAARKLARTPAVVVAPREGLVGSIALVMRSVPYRHAAVPDRAAFIPPSWRAAADELRLGRRDRAHLDHPAGDFDRQIETVWWGLHAVEVDRAARQRLQHRHVVAQLLQQRIGRAIGLRQLEQRLQVLAVVRAEIAVHRSVQPVTHHVLDVAARDRGHACIVGAQRAPQRRAFPNAGGGVTWRSVRP